MKRRPATAESAPDASDTALFEAMAALATPAEVAAFFTDLCTPAEIEAMSDRWRVVPLLLEGVPYREIHERTGVSTTTISRVARSLTHGAGGYHAAAHRLGLRPPHRG